jgi:hypothetical protein
MSRRPRASLIHFTPMSQSAYLDRRLAAPRPASGVRRLVLLSAAFLVLQVATTDYGAGGEESAVAVSWFVVGVALLWLVHRRRSRVARGFIIVLSMGGAVIYTLVAIEDVRAGLLAVLYLGQALPLLAGPVRQHVRSTSR